MRRKRITEETAAKIKQSLVDQPQSNHHEIALEHGVSVTTVYRIDCGQAFSNLEPITPKQTLLKKRLENRLLHSKNMEAVRPIYVQIRTIEDLEFAVSKIKESDDFHGIQLVFGAEQRELAQSILEEHRNKLEMLVGKRRLLVSELKTEIERYNLVMKAIETGKYDELPDDLLEELQRDLDAIRMENKKQLDIDFIDSDETKKVVTLPNQN